MSLVEVDNMKFLIKTLYVVSGANPRLREFAAHRARLFVIYFQTKPISNIFTLSIHVCIYALSHIFYSHCTFREKLIDINLICHSI